MTERETEILLTFGPATLDPTPRAPCLWAIDEWVEGEHVATLAEGHAADQDGAQRQSGEAMTRLSLYVGEIRSAASRVPPVVSVDTAFQDDVSEQAYVLEREPNGSPRAEVGL